MVQCSQRALRIDEMGYSYRGISELSKVSPRFEGVPEIRVATGTRRNVLGAYAVGTLLARQTVKHSLTEQEVRPTLISLQPLPGENTCGTNLNLKQALFRQMKKDGTSP
jgi:hypothetical protein